MRSLLSLALSAVLLLSSCDKEDETNPQRDFSRNVPTTDFLMSSSQVVPAGASTSSATGSIEGTYDRRSKLFNYTLRWTGLAGTIIANGIHLHGTAERGYIAPPSPLGPWANGIVQVVPVTITSSNNRTGVYSGQLYVDGVAVKESDLLSGKYYFDIHTNQNATVQAAGEIRGQILFPVTQ